MELFIIEKNKVIASPEALLIKEFKDIWDSDKSLSKDRAVSELAYVYFTTDYKSIYQSYHEGEIRDNKIKEDIIRDKNWKQSDLITIAIKKYEELQETPTLRMLKGARKAANVITSYYENLKEDKIDGRTVTSITTSLSKIGEVVDSLDKLEQQIRRETKGGKSKGDKAINPFEE